MSIAVFGASGAMGRRFSAAATAAGVALRLHYRSEPEGEAPPLSTVVVGALTDPTAVREVLRGASAVVVLFGPRATNGDVFCAKATKAVIEGMRVQDQRRLLCMTCASLGPPAGNLSIAMRAAALAMKRFRSEELSDDRAQQERVVRASKLDWTIVKPTKFADGGSAESLRAATDLDVGLRSRVSRDSVANFLLGEIATPRFIEQTVFVSGGNGDA